MEMASFLAGEPWSDRPSCTDPVLAELARWVNDMLDDRHRQALVTMVPEVVGLRPDDPRATTELQLTAARAALPVAAPDRQYLMALAVLDAERVLNNHHGRSPGHISEASRTALTSCPAAEHWARTEVAHGDFSPAASRPSSAAKVVALAVDGIARAWVDDRQERLVKLLRDGIDVMVAFSPLAPDRSVVSWPVHDARVSETTATWKARRHRR